MKPDLPPPNYDEALVPTYTLPDVLAGTDGRPATSVADWESRCRPELLARFQDHVYGRLPGRPETPPVVNLVSEESNALSGLATRHEVDLTLRLGGGDTTVRLLIYLPRGQSEPVPAFLGYNFHGNHTVDPDPALHLPRGWMRNDLACGVDNHRADEAGRGTMARRWPLRLILERGCAVVTAYYGDIEPDHADGWRDSLRGRVTHDAQGRPLAPEDWGAIGAWAWGLSRILDYLQTVPEIDGRRVAVIGHSRLGKTALWAGANDPRFAMVVSNESGCGGAALSRRCYGETLFAINTAAPHWFNRTFKAYNDREADCPVDQHQLLALIAPRPLAVGSAIADQWCDPRGEFLALRAATPAYQIYGYTGIEATEPPPLDKPTGQRTQYHCRAGAHDLTSLDWSHYLDLAVKEKLLTA